MASNLNYKQVTNVVRRTWDVEAYEKRAKERAKNEDLGGKKKKGPTGTTASQQVDNNTSSTLLKDDQDESKEEFVPAAAGAAGPHKSQRAFLKARRHKVNVDAKIGSVEIVNPEAPATTKANISGGEGLSNKDAVTKTGIGWHCKVCDCFLRDSHTYLDHINGRKHQRNLGYSMRVERSTKDEVSSRLALLAKEKEQKKSAFDEEEEDFTVVVQKKDEEEKQRKEERKRQRKERKKKAKEEAARASAQQPADEEEEQEVANDDREEEIEEGGVDPALEAMMGFSGFGGGNKNG